MLGCWLPALERDGFVVAATAFTADEAAALADELSAALAAGEQRPTMRSGAGAVVAARNVLELFPRAATVWRRAPLVELLMPTPV